MTCFVVTVTVAVGVLVGVEAAVAFVVNPILDRLPGDAGLLGRVDGARRLGALMPYWYVGVTAAGVLWAVLARQVEPAVASGLLVLGVVLSVALLVPINDRVRTWTAADGTVVAPGDWRTQVGRWERWHVVRVGVLVAAFVCLVLALT